MISFKNKRTRIMNRTWIRNRSCWRKLNEVHQFPAFYVCTPFWVVLLLCILYRVPLSKCKDTIVPYISVTLDTRTLYLFQKYTILFPCLRNKMYCLWCGIDLCCFQNHITVIIYNAMTSMWCLCFVWHKLLLIVQGLNNHVTLISPS